MDKSDMLQLVKDNLKLVDDRQDLVISDVIQDVCDYCHLQELPQQLESFVRKKTKTVIQYEQSQNAAMPFDIKSMSEGNSSITYNVSENTRDVIYGLSDSDKSKLARYRRLQKC